MTCASLPTRMRTAERLVLVTQGSTTCICAVPLPIATSVRLSVDWSWLIFCHPVFLPRSHRWPPRTHSSRTAICRSTPFSPPAIMAVEWCHYRQLLLHSSALGILYPLKGSLTPGLSAFNVIIFCIWLVPSLRINKLLSTRNHAGLIIAALPLVTSSFHDYTRNIKETSLVKWHIKPRLTTVSRRITPYRTVHTSPVKPVHLMVAYTDLYFVDQHNGGAPLAYFPSYPHDFSIICHVGLLLTSQSLG